MNLLTRETYVNATHNTQFGKTEWEDSGVTNPGRLFRLLSREYGRCVSKMYRDGPDEKVETVGWVFQKRMMYEDARPYDGRYSEKDYYLREVWVEVRDVPLCARCGKDEEAHHRFTPVLPVKEAERECAAVQD